MTDFGSLSGTRRSSATQMYGMSLELTWYQFVTWYGARQKSSAERDDRRG